MTGSEPWEQLVEAESKYFESRIALFSSDVETELRKALAHPRGRGAALRVLSSSTDELKMALLPSLFNAAIGTHGDVKLARSVIGSLDNGWLATALLPHVESLASSSKSTWEDFRRVAELLQELKQDNLLRLVVDQSGRSKWSIVG